MFIDFKSCLNYFSQNVNQLKKDYANYLKMKELQQKIESTKRLNNEILIKKEGIKKMLMNEENK
jgi:hypothetical protein